MSRSRSSMASDSHDRLEPRLQKAAETNDLESLSHVTNTARENGQLTDDFLRVGLMRSAERGRIEATHFLLRLGAKADVTPNVNTNTGPNTGNRASPLLRAVERNHVRVVQLLLDHGASTETMDREGRTAVMMAAWKNHWHVLDMLIARGADVNAKDRRRRNVLHNLAADKQCNWGNDVVRLLLGMQTTTAPCAAGYDGADVDGQDELGRTPLHWACATGKPRMVELLLTARRPGADVNAVESRNKTALHIAAAHGREDIVMLLLDRGAAMEARSDGGWTPLHNACDKGSVPTVRILLRNGAHINSQLLNGVTPLHLAAQGGHREVVECLLERSDLKRRVRDNFGSTPFLRAAQFRRKDIVFLLAPFNNVEALSADAKGACEGFEATVVDFGNFHNENRVQKTSVYNLLYGRDKENPRKQAFQTVPADSQATDFRWIHLPANNMAWVEALLTKSFIEEGLHDVDGFKGLERSFNYQHRGQWTHSHFMRPLCQSTPRAMRFREEESSSEEKSEDVASLLPSLVINGSMKNQQRQQSNGNGSSKSKKQKNNRKLDRTDSYPQDDGHKRKGNKHGKPGSGGSAPGTPKLESKIKHPFCHERHQSFSRDPTACNVCVFMPYLHFETAERRDKMQEAIQHAETAKRRPHAPPPPPFSPPNNPGILRSPTRDEMLINAHLASSTASLHVRRTLDQFFYPNIDTKSRDQDQVVYRYQTQCEQGHWMEPKIFMVDQLWMWIVGPNLIVTSFAQRWEQPKNDPLNVLDGIIEDINSKTRDPVLSVYDLAITITNRCSGVFDRHRMGDEEYQFLDMFESAIGTATDRETILFQEFNAASAQASDWLKNHRKLNRFARQMQKQDERLKERWLHGDDAAYYEDEEPLFVDKLLDIGQETDLLAEAKDVRDELNMIRTILQHQKDVLDGFQEVICEIYHGQHRSQYEIKKRFKEQQRTIDMHLKDIDRMDKQAERIYSSITDLLDLKQKHANAFEARFARDQAAGTTRQGKMILVFTIVTIIFLPLSFIASIFDIDIVEFPRGPDGDQQLRLSYVAKYTFGIGFAISIPLIAIALSVDDIGDGCQEAIRRVRRWLTQRKQQKKHHHLTQTVIETQQQQQQQQQNEKQAEIETVYSRKTGRMTMTRTRRGSFDTVGSSLLPVSTRGTQYRAGNVGRKTYCRDL